MLHSILAADCIALSSSKQALGSSIYVWAPFTSCQVPSIAELRNLGFKHLCLRVNSKSSFTSIAFERKFLIEEHEMSINTVLSIALSINILESRCTWLAATSNVHTESIMLESHEFETFVSKESVSLITFKTVVVFIYWVTDLSSWRILRVVWPRRGCRDYRDYRSFKLSRLRRFWRSEDTCTHKLSLYFQKSLVFKY